jgi:hypothetical protein
LPEHARRQWRARLAIRGACDGEGVRNFDGGVSLLSQTPSASGKILDIYADSKTTELIDVAPRGGQR